MKVLYVAGPYRDERGAYYVSGNIRRAGEVALELWRAGHAVICPHKNTAFYDGAAPDETWLNGDLEILSRCDGIVMLPGWWRSEGAAKELEFALDKSIHVYHWAHIIDRIALGIKEAAA